MNWTWSRSTASAHANAHTGGDFCGKWFIDDMDEIPGGIPGTFKPGIPGTFKSWGAALDAVIRAQKRQYETHSNLPCSCMGIRSGERFQVHERFAN